MNVGAHVTAANPAISESMERAMRAWPSRLRSDEFFGPNGLDEIAKDDLLRCLLAHDRLTSVELEKFLSGLRSTLLEKVASEDSEQLSSAAVALYATLAQQCFLNEYIFSAPAQEWRAVE